MQMNLASTAIALLGLMGAVAAAPDCATECKIWKDCLQAAVYNIHQVCEPVTGCGCNLG
ncbi:unnamed protein product [Cercospora beticola]|nr:unnamed protein product [Cercospora beticola]